VGKIPFQSVVNKTGNSWGVRRPMGKTLVRPERLHRPGKSVVGDVHYYGGQNIDGNVVDAAAAPKTGVQNMASVSKARVDASRLKLRISHFRSRTAFDFAAKREKRYSGFESFKWTASRNSLLEIDADNFPDDSLAPLRSPTRALVTIAAAVATVRAESINSDIVGDIGGTAACWGRFCGLNSSTLFFSLRGRVQGVMCRQTLVRGAARRGLRMGATNELDGSVSVTVEGRFVEIHALMARVGDGTELNSWGALADTVEEIQDCLGRGNHGWGPRGGPRCRSIAKHQVTTENVDTFKWNKDVQMHI
jgi:acylphosphatase